MPIYIVNAAGTFRTEPGDKVTVIDPAAGRTGFEVVLVQESAGPTKLITCGPDLPDDVEELADEAVDLPAGSYMLLRLVDLPGAKRSSKATSRRRR